MFSPAHSLHSSNRQRGGDQKKITKHELTYTAGIYNIQPSRFVYVCHRVSRLIKRSEQLFDMVVSSPIETRRCALPAISLCLNYLCSIISKLTCDRGKFYSIVAPLSIEMWRCALTAMFVCVNYLINTTSKLTSGKTEDHDTGPSRQTVRYGGDGRIQQCLLICSFSAMRPVCCP